MTSSSRLSKPNAVIGFTALLNGPPEAAARSQAALRHALAHFGNIQQLTINLGQTALTIWGRGQLEDCVHQLPDGSHLILCGSPVGKHTWQDIEEKLMATAPGEFVLPWEGRVILLRIEPQSNTWTFWNDWMGSIPVYYGQTTGGRISSTLEPVVVDALNPTADDFYLPSLLALLMWGHYFSNWSLFKSIKMIRADCEATWDSSGYREIVKYSIPLTEDRWQMGWDDLLDEMHALSKKAIADSLDQAPQWILPLSSGLDSRLIAGVAAELNRNVYAYTWGGARTSDTIHAEKIARVLGIPWKFLRSGSNYLKSYKDLWISLFGSAMHFHGMYQMPFLDALQIEPTGPIISGFIGDCLAGYDVKFSQKVYTSKRPYQLTPDDYMHWQVKELSQLLRIHFQDALDELAAEVKRVTESLNGALHHRLRMVVLWGRQRHFTYFQSMLSDYWRGVSTPYLDRNYVRFSFSLPRAVLDERILQQAMLARYYPKLAAIPGTYAPEPALLTGSYLIKKRIAKHLPERLAKTMLPDIFRIRSKTEVECVKNDGQAAFGSLFDPSNGLEKWMDRALIANTYRSVIEEEHAVSIRKLQSIETFAYRLSTR